jgi:hypothetical protein
MTVSQSTAYRFVLAVAALFVWCGPLVAVLTGPVCAAEATTGGITGSVTTVAGEPVARAGIVATSASGRAATTSDARGRFRLLGLTPDTYAVSVEAAGYEAVTQRGVLVLPGQLDQVAVRVAPVLKTIGSVRAASGTFTVGATSDAFTVSAEAARALAPPANASGLGTYLSGTVQGAIANVPGVQTDAFGNSILRGGKVDDTVFDYDSVPIPQGLIAEPGGNIVGAQLATTGIASTTVTLAGYGAQGDNALGGVVNQIPALGTYPGRTSLELTQGLGSRNSRIAFQTQQATPDLRWRWALASTAGSQELAYGDARTFYPSEAATYGLSLASRGESSVAANVHFRLRPGDDLAFVGLTGAASYHQYGSPYPGQTVGAFDGQNTVFPGETNPNAPVTYPAGVHGTYDILKLQWLHTSPSAVSRVQLYRSQFGSRSGGPFWDDLSFPNGGISFDSQQGGREIGLTYDADDLASEHHHLTYGTELRTNTSFLHQVVPTADELIASNPTLHSYLAYLGDSWSAGRLTLAGTARFTRTDISPSDGARYSVAALDPHFSAAYRLGRAYALRATFDHTTVAPKPLQADRTDSTNPAPFVPLAAETSNDFSYSLEGSGRTQFRLTYYGKLERNRIDVLPVNFRSIGSSGAGPSGIGVPTNAGELRVHGLELYAKNGRFALGANAIRGLSSSASQFAYNDLNAPAIAAGHLFPLGYVPDFTATLSYEFRPTPRLRITPSLSYESGYPYGNGKKVYVFDPLTNLPVRVNNDDNVNPGASYYFLRDPSQPFDAVTNPYVGSLGTPEGDDPNTLRSRPQTLVNLHLEGDLTPRLTAIADVSNLFGVSAPTALQSNPYLYGPPGDPRNGIPTNDGIHQSLPWTYGTGGYVPQGYPLARTAWLGLRYRF